MLIKGAQHSFLLDPPILLSFPVLHYLEMSFPFSVIKINITTPPSRVDVICYWNLVHCHSQGAKLRKSASLREIICALRGPMKLCQKINLIFEPRDLRNPKENQVPGSCTIRMNVPQHNYMVYYYDSHRRKHADILGLRNLYWHQEMFWQHIWLRGIMWEIHCKTTIFVCGISCGVFNYSQSFQSRVLNI